MKKTYSITYNQKQKISIDMFCFSNSECTNYVTISETFSSLPSNRGFSKKKHNS